MSTKNGSILESLAPFEGSFEEQAADPALLGYVDVLDFLSFEGLPDEVESSTDWPTPIGSSSAPSEQRTPSENPVFHVNPDTIGLMSLPYYSWDEDEEDNTVDFLQLVDGITGTVFDGTEIESFFDGPFDGTDRYDQLPPSISPSLLSLPSTPYHDDEEEECESEAEALVVSNSGVSETKGDKTADLFETELINSGEHNNQNQHRHQTATCLTSEILEPAVPSTDPSSSLELGSTLPKLEERVKKTDLTGLSHSKTVSENIEESGDAYEATLAKSAAEDTNGHDYGEVVDRRSRKHRKLGKARGTATLLAKNQTHDIQPLDEEKLVWSPGELINELPPNLDALVQHLQQQRTDITKLLPHSISVERFFIRKRLDADGIEMESKYRCDATRRLAADDNGWVEIPRCGVIVTGKDSYKRHLKSRHLGITRTPKASLNLSEWIKRNSEEKPVVGKRRRADDLTEENAVGEAVNDHSYEAEERPMKRLRLE